MKVQRYRIYTSTTPDTGIPTDSADLTILPVDRMMAERHAAEELPPSQRGRGAAENHPHAWLLLWLWSASRRVGLTGQKFADWSPTVMDFDPIDADGDVVTKDQPEAGAVELDPTNGAADTI